jgi:YHS domain-containing protein
MKTLLLIITLSTIMMEANAQTKPVFTDDNQVALGGYDVVNYFTGYEARKGTATHVADHNGVKYYFVSEEHKQMFMAAPDRYLPAYGGYCAFAMGMKNTTVPSNPETFKIYQGKLYVFFNDLYEGQKFNTIIPWNSDEVNIKQRADGNWQAMK